MRVGVHFYTKDRCLSGVERYGLELIRSLATGGCGNECVVLTAQPEVVAEYLAGSPGPEIVRVSYPRFRVGRIAYEHLGLPAAAERAGLDILHCPSYICPARRGCVPYVVTMHDTFALDHPKWCQWANARYYRLLLPIAAKQAAAIVAVSSRTAADLERHFPEQSHKINVVHPSLDRAFYLRKSDSECDRIRRRYGLPARYVLYVGNVEPKKNLKVLLEAHSSARRRGLPHALVLTGPRTWRARWECREIALARARGTIVVTGYVSASDLPAVYQMADAYVCTSLEEGFGYPPLEAMASGVPVVSSTSGALAETVGQAACPVDARDAEQVADAILRIVSDERLRRECVSRGLALASRFDGRESAQRLQALYQQVRQQAQRASAR